MDRGSPQGALSVLRSRGAALAVSCFACRIPFGVERESPVGVCPVCRHPNDLQSYDVDRPWNRVIQTHGDVVVHALGSYGFGQLRCRDLTIYGHVDAEIICGGFLAFRTSARILRRARSARLLVERNARISFLHRVRTGEAVIRGQVAGELECAGELSVGRHGEFEGALEAEALDILPGARFLAVVKIVPAR